MTTTDETPDLAALRDEIAELAVRAERFEVERDAARAEHDRAVAEVAELTQKRDYTIDDLNHQLAGYREAYPELEREVATLKERLAGATRLLARAVKYATEDRMVTPGVTRLARLHDEARAYLAAIPQEVAAPPSTRPSWAPGVPTMSGRLPYETPTVEKMTPADRVFNCPECGPGVYVDEDGCCTTCGRDAPVTPVEPPEVLTVSCPHGVLACDACVTAAVDGRPLPAATPKGEPRAATFVGVDPGGNERTVHRCTGCEWFINTTCMSEEQVTRAVHEHLHKDHNAEASPSEPQGEAPPAPKCRCGHIKAIHGGESCTGSCFARLGTCPCRSFEAAPTARVKCDHGDACPGHAPGDRPCNWEPSHEAAPPAPEPERCRQCDGALILSCPEGCEPPEKCESGCAEPVTHHDVEGVPLCTACFESLPDGQATEDAPPAPCDECDQNDPLNDHGSHGSPEAAPTAPVVMCRSCVPTARWSEGKQESDEKKCVKCGWWTLWRFPPEAAPPAPAADVPRGPWPPKRGTCGSTLAVTGAWRVSGSSPERTTEPLTAGALQTSAAASATGGSTGSFATAPWSSSAAQAQRLLRSRGARTAARAVLVACGTWS